LGRQPKFTKDQLLQALKDSGNDPIRAAVALSVSPSTIYRSMVRNGLTVVSQRRIERAA
jgi:transcriptional regulator of acetoin/glycerol metabolism